MVAPLSEVPQEGSSVLFSLIKLHLASHPLDSSYSRVTVSSAFCAHFCFFGASMWGPPITAYISPVKTVSAYSAPPPTNIQLLCGYYWFKVVLGVFCFAFFSSGEYVPLANSRRSLGSFGVVGVSFVEQLLPSSPLFLRDTPLTKALFRLMIFLRYRSAFIVAFQGSHVGVSVQFMIFHDPPGNPPKHVTRHYPFPIPIDDADSNILLVVDRRSWVGSLPGTLGSDRYRHPRPRYRSCSQHYHYDGETPL